MWCEPRLEASAEEVQELLNGEEARTAILHAASAVAKRYRTVHGSRLMYAGEIVDSDTDRLYGTARPGWAPTAVALDKVLEVSGRGVGGHHWFTAWVRWLLVESRARPGGFVEERLTYAWETRVLLSPTVDKALTVLDSRRPNPISYRDIPKVPDLPEGGQRDAGEQRCPDVQLAEGEP